MLRLFPLATRLVLVVPVAAGLAGVFLPAFGYLPVLGRSEFSLDAFRMLAEQPGLARSVLLSLCTGLAATIIAGACVMLFVAGWSGTRSFAVIERLLSPLLSVPHAAAAVGLAFLIAPSGFLFRIVAPIAGIERPPDLLIVQDRLGVAMTLGLIVKETPFLFLMALAALPQARVAELARLNASLGYGRIAGFWIGALPSVYRQVRLAVFAVLAFSTSVVDVALILGPTTPAPLAVRILEWRNDPALDGYMLAAAGAVLQAVVTALALLAWLAGERGFGALARWAWAAGRRCRRDRWLRMWGVSAVMLSAGALLASIALLALWSLAGPWPFPEILPQSPTLTTWRRLASGLADPLAHSVALAAASSLIATVLVLGSLEFQSRRGDPAPGVPQVAFFLPLIVPQVAFLFGLQVLFAAMDLDGSFPAVLLAHLVFVLPYVMLSLSEPWRSWDPRYSQMMRALGRSEDAVFWRARLPMLARPVGTAAALGFAVSVALYLPTLLVGAGRWPTITTETLALASGGERKLTGATALVQALLPFVGFAVAAVVSSSFAFRRRP